MTKNTKYPQITLFYFFFWPIHWSSNLVKFKLSSDWIQTQSLQIQVFFEIPSRFSNLKILVISRPVESLQRSIFGPENRSLLYLESSFFLLIFSSKKQESKLSLGKTKGLSRIKATTNRWRRRRLSWRRAVSIRVLCLNSS